MIEVIIRIWKRDQNKGDICKIDNSCASHSFDDNINHNNKINYNINCNDNDDSNDNNIDYDNDNKDKDDDYNDFGDENGSNVIESFVFVRRVLRP